MSRLPATIVVASGLTVAALVVAGCGSDHEKPDTSANTRSTWTTTVADNMTRTARAHLVGPRAVRVGDPVTLSGSGFPPGRSLAFVADPTKFHRFQGVGIVIHNKRDFRTGAEGRFTVTFRFPRVYCFGPPGCSEKPFTPGWR
jgi:hypothetical protein